MGVASGAYDGVALPSPMRDFSSTIAGHSAISTLFGMRPTPASFLHGSIIRANQCAAGYNKGGGEDLGRSCGGFSTKIHALVDALGNPVKFLLGPGNDHDIIPFLITN
jgi:hypothetical protein